MSCRRETARASGVLCLARQSKKHQSSCRRELLESLGVIPSRSSERHTTANLWKHQPGLVFGCHGSSGYYGGRHATASPRKLHMASENHQSSCCRKLLESLGVVPSLPELPWQPKTKPRSSKCSRWHDLKGPSNTNSQRFQKSAVA